MQWFLWGVQDILNLVLNKNEVTKNNNSNKKARVNFLLIQNKTACNNNHRKSATVAGATSVCTGTAAAVLLLCRSLQSRKGWGWGWKWAQGWGCRWRWAWGWGWVWSLLQFCCPQETTVLGTCPLYLWDGCNVRSYLWFWQAHMHKIRLNERPIVIWRGNY